MDAFPKNVRALISSADITQQAFADSIGVSLTTVNGWLKRGVQPKRFNLDSICGEYGVSHNDLLSDSDGLYAKAHGLASAPAGAVAPPPPRMATAPLLGRVHAGDAGEPDVLDDAVSLPYEVWERHKRAYFLEVEGTCMSRVYPEGCHVLVDPDRAPQNGSVAVVSIDGADYVMRKLYRGSTSLMLVADSYDDGWDDIIVSGDDHSVEVVGTVVWYQPREEFT
jgi:repressor LexA